MHELDASRVEPYLQTQRYGRSLRALDVTGSTNDDARADAASGAASGHVVLADMQSSGRGSNGRAWSSPRGQDLFFSIVDRPAVSLPQLPPLTLAVGLGVAEAVESVVGTPGACQVKWPNDVWLNGKKCAGILVETSALGSTVESVVIGIGLNVNRLEFDEELRDIATSLRATSSERPPFDRPLVLAKVLFAVEHQVDRFVAEGPASIVQALEPRLAMIGERAVCGEIEGVVTGVSSSGALLMRTERGVVEVHAGRLMPLPA
ncbi:MAG TPA: biotin--[acetyl-CoA-carboxylase] ligase [Polyangiales bacterium]|nr:biotin--[acetyl-CoA-carboxylase] ligase [Polyangiales bacterium]